MTVILNVPAVLQLFCSSPKAALRYAAVRTLNKVQLQTYLMVIKMVFFSEVL